MLKLQYKIDTQFLRYAVWTTLTYACLSSVYVVVGVGTTFWPIWLFPPLLGVTILLTAYDFRYRILPDGLIIVACVLFLLRLFSHAEDIKAALIGGVVGALTFYLIRLAMFQLTGRIGLGLGDVKLMGCIGLAVGPFALAPVVLVASIFGLVSTICCGFVSKKKTQVLRSHTAIAFGPFLLLGLWFSLLFPNVFYVIGTDVVALLLSAS